MIKADLRITQRRWKSRVRLVSLVFAFAGLLSGLVVSYYLSGKMKGMKIGLLNQSGWLYANREIIAYILLPLVFAVFFHIIARKTMLYYPHIIASTRKNEIDLTIQHSVTYLYAMSMGGLSLNESIKSLGKQANIYGEAANELGRIGRDTELLGKSSLSAINDLIDNTPSRKMADFLKGLVSVIKSKGDLTDYFRLKAKQYHSEAEVEQKMFLEMLGSLSEAYVVALVAGPMFLIVIGIVMGMVGGGFNNALFAVIYGIIPIASIAFIVLISSMSRTPFEKLDIFVYQKELRAFKEVLLFPKMLENPMNCAR